MMGSVCVCVCVCLGAVRAMGRYERVQGNEVLTGGRWGGRWGRWSSGRGTDAAPAAAVPPGRWAESSSSASWCLLVSLVLEASAKFQVSGLCSCELVASVAARDGVVGEMRACVTMGGARCEALEARVLMQLPMLAGVMTATAIDDGMRLMVAQERAIGKPSSGAECGKQVFFLAAPGRGTQMREQFGGASAAQPEASPAIRSLCWFASRRATDEKQRAAGTSGRQATGDTPRARPGSCSAAARAPAPPATARRPVHASACREARRDDARASRMREWGPESKRQEKKVLTGWVLGAGVSVPRRSGRGVVV